jgi:hypothetical protein
MQQQAIIAHTNRCRWVNTPTAGTLTGQTPAGCFCSRSIQAPSAGLDSKLVISA